MDVAGLLATLSGLSVLPAFYSPLLATSTSNFWGRRWNLTAVRLLRAGVYRPARLLGAPRPLAVGLSFAVSGVAHELIVWYSSSSGAAYAAVRGQWLAFFLVQAPIVVAEPALSSLTSHVTPSQGPTRDATRRGACALCAHRSPGRSIPHCEAPVPAACVHPRLAETLLRRDTCQPPTTLGRAR